MQGKKKYEEYQSHLGELATKMVLERLSDLQLHKIPEKKNQRNPDYEIRDSNGKVIGICEVKSLVEPLKSEDLGEGATQEEWAALSRKRDRNHRSKLRQHLGKAIPQLQGHADLPIVVCFVSFDMTDYIDMGMVLQEHIELHTDLLPDMFILMKVHQDIVPSGSFEVKETIRLMYNSERGDQFGRRYLDWSQSLQKAGALPLKFKIESS